MAKMGDGDLSTLPASCERKSVLGIGLNLVGESAGRTYDMIQEISLIHSRRTW